MTNKIIAMVIGQNCEQTIDMCLESIQKADEVYFLDGGSIDNTLFEVKRRINEENILSNKWDNSDKEMNGKQRNFYLDFLKNKHKDDWCLVLDADEVLEDLGMEKLKYFIEQENYKDVLISPRIHHFVGDLGHEDVTKDIHYVPNRIFKITEDLFYPKGAHPVLQGTKKRATIDIHIWHFRECLGVFNTNKKHIDNWEKSEMHSKGYLQWWYYQMLFGNYPRKKVYYGDLPLIIRRRFSI